MESIHDESYKGFTIEIYPDQDAQNPREEFSPLGHITMCYTPRGEIDLSDKNAITLEDAHDYRRSIWPGKKPGYFQYRCLTLLNDVAVALPLWHSSVGISADAKPLTYKDNDEPAGFIYLTKEELHNEYGDGPEAVTMATKYMLAEVKEFSSYLEGDVYGYQITRLDIDDGDPLDIDSCWGFYGFDYCLEEARSAVDSLVKPLEARSA